MCGIVSIFNIKQQTAGLREKALRMSQKIRHRGPDWSGIYCGKSAILAHERLSIVDPESGKQPLFSPDGKQILAVNGEIYNHQEIRRQYADRFRFQRELFGGNADLMNSTLDRLDACSTIEEAEDIINDFTKWNPEDENVNDFLKLLGRRF